MIARAWYSALVVLAVAASGCDRTETSSAPVTSTSPAGTSTAPSAASAKTRQETLLRVVQATPNDNNLDLFAGDLLLFDSLAYKSVSTYRALEAQRYALGLRAAGMTRGKALTMNSEDLKDGEYYTAFAMPQEEGGTHLQIVNDQNIAPAAGRALLRVVHAGIDTGKLDVRAAGTSTTLVGAVNARSVGEYLDVAPFNGIVDIVGEDKTAPALARLNLHLEAGRFYTLIIVGSARSAPPLEAFLIEDALSR
jgi:hypothetical protein